MTNSLIDCDSHFWQPFEVWESHVDPRHKDAVATWLDDHDLYKTLDPDVAAVIRRRMLEDPADDPKVCLEESGDLPSTLNLDITVDLLLGPSLTRVLVSGDAVDERDVRETVRTVLAGVIAAADAR
jgi:hypothetical protein